jgi:predicted SAM-dependent methyltransferase
VRSGIRFCHQYLKAGGRLRIAVPDANHPDPAYLKMVLPPADDHRSTWTVESLSALLVSCGFRVEPLEYYSANHELTALPVAPLQGPVSRSIQRKDIVPLISGYSSLIVDAVKH